jgi:hypothetical protein
MQKVQLAQSCIYSEVYYSGAQCLLAAILNSQKLLTGTVLGLGSSDALVCATGWWPIDLP